MLARSSCWMALLTLADGLLPVKLLPVGLLPVGLLPVGLLPVRLLPVALPVAPSGEAPARGWGVLNPQEERSMRRRLTSIEGVAYSRSLACSDGGVRVAFGRLLGASEEVWVGAWRAVKTSTERWQRRRSLRAAEA